MTEIRTIDLFCGCGGLSLGFELHGAIDYRTILALDNHGPAIRCLNENHEVADASVWPTGRVCDLTWFANSSEFLLYYLVHFARSQPDPQLVKTLYGRQISLAQFLAQLREIDDVFAVTQGKLYDSPSFLADKSKIDSGVFSTAVCKGFFERLGIAHLGKRTPSKLVSQPWVEEYGYERESLKKANTNTRITVSEKLASDIRDELCQLWDSNLSMLGESCEAKARGKNVSVIERLKTLVAFLRSGSGQQIRDAWLKWRTERDSLRVCYSANKHEQLQKLYDHGRNIHLVLGGPPCKGFSRMGRPVASSLTEQGTYSWASTQYVDQRNALMFQYVMVLQALKPAAFLFENVENFKSPLKRKGTDSFDPAIELQDAIDELADHNLHFHVKSGLVKASEHGVPQNRIRFIMAGLNATAGDDSCLKDFLVPTEQDASVPLSVALAGLEPPTEFVFGEPSAKVSDRRHAYTFLDKRMPKSHQTYVSWIRQPAPQRNSRPASVDAHIVRRMRDDDFALLQKFAPGQRWMDYASKRSSTLDHLKIIVNQLEKYQRKHDSDELSSLSELESIAKKLNDNFLLRLLIECSSPNIEFERENHLLTGGYLSRGMNHHGDWFERMDANRPSKTIVAHIGKDTYGYMHPFAPRPISIREAARIQSFPDFFKFGSAGVVDAYSMIGNAVPPLLSSYFAERLSEMHLRHGIFNRKKLNGVPATKRLRRKRQSGLFP